MPLEILCPNGHRLQVMPEQAGQKVRCPTCQQVFVVPDHRTVAPPTQAASGAKETFPDLSGPPIKPKSRSYSKPPDFAQLTRWLAQAALISGLLLAITARGCDTLGSRDVASAQTKFRLAQDRFEDSFETKKLSIQTELDEIREKDKLSKDDNDRIEKLKKDLKDSEEKRTKETKTRQQGEWRNLKIAARDAASNNVTWGYWREALFLFGTMLLSVGLIVVGFNGAGAERWICLTILAIIIFSIYVGGIAWIANIPRLG